MWPKVFFFFFLWGHRGGKMWFWGDKNSKNLPKMADFGHFFSDGGKWGAEPPTGGECPPCPPPLMPPLYVTITFSLKQGETIIKNKHWTHYSALNQVLTTTPSEKDWTYFEISISPFSAEFHKHCCCPW